MGYDDANGDFDWSTAVSFAKQIRLYEDGLINELKKAEYTRGLLAICTYKALETDLNNSHQLLIVKLVDENAISEEAAIALGFEDVFADNTNINKKEYSEINYKIGGTDPGGGIIFWLDGNGRGLEITPFDLEVGGNEYSGLGLTVEPFEFDSSVGGI
ncbi:MAG: hypothetical protein GX115_05285 [Ruminiclostridium sp.]|nr:hypothetical protein [Ruminiclostridium sp.]